MDVDGDHPDEITSFRVNQACNHDLVSLGKKRKFLSETKEQPSLQKSKYICCETLPFPNQSSQSEVFYTHTRKGKAPLQQVDEDTHTRQESTQDSNSIAGESFSHSSNIKSSYDESTLTSLQSGRAISSDSTMGGDEEVQGDGICEEKLDEFGYCLTYLGSACGSDSNKPETDQELEEFLCANGMIPRSSEEEAQLGTGKATIDQEFEHYFSTLML